MVIDCKKHKKWITILFLIVLVLFFAIVFLQDNFASKKELNTTNKLSVNTEPTADMKPTLTTNPDEEYFDIKTLHFRAKLNSKKQIATIRWKTVPQAIRYVIKCYEEKQENGDWKKIDEKTIYPSEKNVYKNHISYGKDYKYEIAVYENSQGRELMCILKNGEDSLFIRSTVPPISWSAEAMPMTTGKKKSIDLAFSYLDGTIGHFEPSGFEIYRGETKKHMILLDTIKVTKTSQLQKYQDKRAKKNINYFYQVRAYAQVNGKKVYGKKSPAKELSLDDSWGNCNVTFLTSSTETVDKIQMIITNTDKMLLKFGKKFVKRNKDVLRFFFDGEYHSPLFTLNDEISYKRKQSEQYRMLTETDEILIKPGENLYIQFMRKNHKEFYNPIEINGEMSSNMIVLYLFYYKGHNAFLDMDWIDEKWVSYIKWRDEDEAGYN